MVFAFPVGIDRPLMRIPYVSLTILGLNFLIYFLTIPVLLMDPLSFFTNPIHIRFGSIPGHNSLLTLFTAMFLHADMSHLLGNMLIFFIAGLKLEDVMGPWRFLLFYLGAGIAADASHAILSGWDPLPAIGASGAIAGCMGGFMMLYPRSRVRFVYTIFFLIYGTFRLASWFVLGFWFAREIFSYLIVEKFGVGSTVAFGAHIGGFLVGALWVWSFYGWNKGTEMDEGEAPGTPVDHVIVAPTMRQ